MFSIPGIVGLLTFIFVRPQEIFPGLERIPFLYLFCALSLFGLVIDLKLRLVKPVPSPQLLWAVLVLVWILISIGLKTPSHMVKEQVITIGVAFLLFLVLAQGVQSFKILQVITVTVGVFSLFLALIASHQGVAPLGCLLIEEADIEHGEPDGRSCVERIDCYGPDAEPGGEYMCEHIGLFGTSSIHKRVRWRGVLKDPNELSMAIACGLALLLGFATRKRSLRWFLAAVVATVLVMVALIMTKSRGGQLVFLGVLGVYFVKRFGVRGMAIGLVLAVPLMLLGGRGGESASESAMDRLEAWREGINMLASSPIFGVGQRQFAEVHGITAHNSYVLVFAELGAVGMLLWTTLLYMSVKIVYSGVRRFADEPGAEVARVWGLALLAALCGMMIGITFLSFAYHNVLWIYFGLCGGYYSAVKSHAPDWRVPFGLKDAALIAVLNIGFLIGLAVYLRIRGF